MKFRHLLSCDTIVPCNFVFIISLATDKPTKKLLSQVIDTCIACVGWCLVMLPVSRISSSFMPGILSLEDVVPNDPQILLSVQVFFDKTYCLVS